MADLRSLDLDATDYGLKVQSLYRNQETLTGGSANPGPYYGFYVGTVDSTWSFTPYDGKAAITFTPTANTYYNFHVSTITPAASGTGFGNVGGHRYELVDPISTWTVDAQGSVAGGVFTVTVSGDSDLTSASSVLPTIGEVYEYTVVVSSYDSATTAQISYGGVDMYNKDAAGTYTGTLTASSGAGLVVTVTGVATSNFVVDSISIKRRV